MSPLVGNPNIVPPQVYVVIQNWETQPEVDSIELQ